jgi:DNA-directed RNA polymerase sigma subunit (sigma70/sigma32)
MRFGLGGEPPRTLEETAARFRLSSERIRQLEQEIFRGMPPHQKLGLLRLYREAVGIPLVVKPEAKIGQKAREDGILARRRGLKRVHHDVLAYRFGFSGGKPHTLEETARRHRMTRANVWLITNAALKRCLDEGRLTDWQWLQERARQAETRSQRRRESVKCRSRKNR